MNHICFWADRERGRKIQKMRGFDSMSGYKYQEKYSKRYREEKEFEGRKSSRKDRKMERC